MKKDDIAALIGAEVAVEWPGYEAHVGFGAGAAMVLLMAAEEVERRSAG
jgi:hypothetical protein